MRLNSKVTMGLAWTGLAVVLAVPSADYLTSAFGGGDKSAVLTSDVEQAVTAKPALAAKPAATETTEAKPTQTASIAPTVTTTKTSNGVIITPAGTSLPQDPVDKYLQSGKALPDYISDSSPTTTTPAQPVVTAPAETQIASVDPKVAPTPFPAWARPAFTPAPAQTATVKAAPVKTTPAAPVVTATQPEPVVIVDERTQTGSIAVPTGPVPPSPIVDDTQNWETESLRDYLERRGILEGDTSRSTATVTQRSNDYDPDGFYLSDGPNSDRETRRQRILRMLEESEDDPYGFTLF